MKNDIDRNGGSLRMSDRGLEAAADEGGEDAPASAEKKKYVILAVLLVVGVGVMGYQFLGIGGPKEADAETAALAAGQADPSAVESVLSQLDVQAKASDAEATSVARVETLVKEFDTYVRDRQVPLGNLQANPFTVVVLKEEKPAAGASDTSAPAPAVNADDDPEVQAAARAKAVREAASRLVLGSIVVAGDQRLVVVCGKLCRRGDKVDGFTVERIEADRVVVARDGVTVTLLLKPVPGSA